MSEKFPWRKDILYRIFLYSCIAIYFVERFEVSSKVAGCNYDVSEKNVTRKKCRFFCVTIYLKMSNSSIFFSKSSAEAMIFSCRRKIKLSILNLFLLKDPINKISIFGFSAVFETPGRAGFWGRTMSNSLGIWPPDFLPFWNRNSAGAKIT